MNVLFVPSLGLDLSLLERLADSVDHSIKYKVAFNNGTPGALDSFADRHPDWIVKESHVGNMGVAGSWNYCAKWFSAEPCWLLMNEDAYFLPGYLKKICKEADQRLDKPIIYLNNTHAYYCFVWTQTGLREVGEFDQNLWPAYYEDCDYRIRLKLAGFPDHTHPYALYDLPALPHGKPRTGGTNYAAMIQGTGLLNRRYWQRKWGSIDVDYPVFKHPYSDQRLTHRDVVWYPEHRANLVPLWDAFMQVSGSIYD